MPGATGRTSRQEELVPEATGRTRRQEELIPRAGITKTEEELMFREEKTRGKRRGGGGEA